MRYAIVEDGVVTNVVIADESLASERGWIATDTAGPGWSYAGGLFSPPASEIGDRRAALLSSIIAERDRRLALGFDHDFGDARGVHRIGTTPADLTGWDEVTKWSDAAIALGQTSQTVAILTDTGPTLVTALDWKGVIVAATAFRQPIWHRSFELQAAAAAAPDLAALDAIDIMTGWPE